MSKTIKKTPKRDEMRENYIPYHEENWLIDYNYKPKKDEQDQKNRPEAIIPNNKQN